MKEFLSEARAWVRDVGFPAFVAIYLLVSLGPKLDSFAAKLDKCITILEVKK